MKITEIEISVFEVPMYPAVTDVVEVNDGTDKERLDKAVRDWLSLGPKGRPKNDSRKGS